MSGVFSRARGALTKPIGAALNKAASAGVVPAAMARPVSDKLNKWKADVYLAKGWQRKGPGQQAMREEMAGACDRAQRADLHAEVDNLGDPPWNSATAMAAAGLKMRIDVETLPQGSPGVEKLGGIHEFPAFWINKQGGGGQPDKSFLFKPKGSNEVLFHIPPGGDTAREAMAGRFGDLLNGMTGLDFGVPETHIVQLDANRLPNNAVTDEMAPARGGGFVGSLQQFARSGGDLRDRPIEDRRKIPAAACHKIAIFDMLTLNCDRHASNLLVRADGDGQPALVPIDHGLSFPPAVDSNFGAISDTMGDAFHAVLGLQGAHRPFDDKTKAAIAGISPDALVQGTKKELATLEKRHPGMGGLIDDGTLEWTRRSAMFLKLAAAHDPALTAAAAQVALGQNTATLFAPSLDDRAFAAAAGRILARAADNQEALADLLTMPMEMRAAIESKLLANGWPEIMNKIDRKWLLTNPKLALQLARGDLVNRGKTGELATVLAGRPVPQPLQGKTVAEVFSQNLTAHLPGGLVNGTADIEKREAAFPGDTPIDRGNPTAILKASLEWQAFERFGGMRRLDQAIGLASVTGATGFDPKAKFDHAMSVMRIAAGMRLAEKIVRDQGPAGLGIDARRVRMEFDLVAAIAATEIGKSNPIQIPVFKFSQLTIDGSDGQKKLVRILHDRVVEAVAQEQMPRLKALETLLASTIAAGNTAGSEERDLQRVLRQIVAIKDGTVSGSLAIIQGLEARYPNQNAPPQNPAPSNQTAQNQQAQAGAPGSSAVQG